MRHQAIGMIVLVGIAGVLSSPVFAQTPSVLPEYLTIELKHLEETWNILDRFAEKVWPGSKNYAEVPFNFRYPNGVQMLVGHPSPTDGYELVPGVEVRGKKVYLNRREEIPLEMKPPLAGGGGILMLGKDKLVQSVDLRMDPIPKELRQEEIDFYGGVPLPEELRVLSDRQILINIHELFHCFQRDLFEYRYGNLMFNPDAEYALYSEIEGSALEKAYLETDPGKSAEFIKDFLAARDLKRKSMTDIEKIQEAEDDVGEGTAVYSEVRILELLKTGYAPILTPKDDPWYSGFKDADAFLTERLNNLRGARSDTLEAKGKCYPYGCFQAVLLSRHFPGWQETFFQKGLSLEQVLEDQLKMTAEDLKAVAGRLATRYPIEEISRRTGGIIGQRDAALKTIMDRKGRVYVVDFKPTHEYLNPKACGESYRVGLINLFLGGIEKIQIQEVELTGEKMPMITDQLYYFKWVDTEPQPEEKGYSIVSSRKEGDDVYVDAVFTAKGFTLKAPKIRVKDGPSRVKIQILEKVKTEK